jgi:hypothetical protein
MMHLYDSLHSFKHTPLHTPGREAGPVWLPTRHQLVWTALTVAFTASVIASPGVRMLMSMLFKVAWVYMVAVARG